MIKCEQQFTSPRDFSANIDLFLNTSNIIRLDRGDSLVLVNLAFSSKSRNVSVHFQWAKLRMKAIIRDWREVETQAIDSQTVHILTFVLSFAYRDSHFSAWFGRLFWPFCLIFWRSCLSWQMSTIKILRTNVDQHIYLCGLSVTRPRLPRISFEIWMNSRMN
jgi:hypothetical protein